MTELGKAGKRIGEEHPRVTRRIDPEPPKPTPPAPESKPRGRYGFDYRFTDWPKWGILHSWFSTERARDQSYENMKRKIEQDTVLRGSAAIELLEKVER